MTTTTVPARTLLTHPAGWIASGFGAGLSPVAPGTVGAFAALLPWLGLRELSPGLYLAAVAVAFVIGVWACGRAIGMVGAADPRAVVWDEFVGQWIALAPLQWFDGGWIAVAAAFALFRAYDVLKPWPIGWADRRVGGGFGIMLDDLLAGVCAAWLVGAALWLTGGG
jgi:phosphatidylglycerophosphatase A